MQKAYDLVDWEHLEKSLVRIKMCDRFIRFFGSIYRDHTNQVMMDFGLIDGYSIHNRLDQEEVFFPLLWHIFYDLLLCEVKHQKNVCGYRINSHFISRSGHADSRAEFFSFFAVGAFNAIQHILNVASEFFQINDILINNDKTVAIFINSKVSHPSLFISDSPISVAYKGESYQYLGIFLSTESLSKSSLTKAHSDICFFTNLVLKKAVSDKQFLYLVLAVFHPIVGYRTQFSFVSISGLKLKSGLLLDFSGDTIYHLSFYGLKSFSQCQSESKIASLISFANSDKILGFLFSHSFSAHIHVIASNNFLSGMMSMSIILDESLFFKFLSFLWHYGIAFQWKKLDPHEPVSDWFKLSVAFFIGSPPSSLASDSVGPLNICGSSDFVSVCNCFSQVGSDSLSVYTDGSLKDLDIIGCWAGTAAFFEDINLGLGVSVYSLVSSTLAELQAIVLALEYIPMFCSVCLFSDSQAALDACKLELNLIHPDFRN
ncbi:hypothetical protein G9A89_002992 [Geosiphon pyriformis]|nr:hypothetical protein G9A89_002992 [Geosiphon pyriformis]